MTEIEGNKPPKKRDLLKDENYRGEDYTVNPELTNGPLFSRRCTDVLCLVVFILFIGAYIGTVAYSWNHGKLNHLLRPVNGDGKLCGVDELAEFPKLYYLVRETDAELRAVCVRQCPVSPTAPLDCFGTSRVNASDCANPKYYIGYGTTTLLKRFCLPDPDKLSKHLNDSAYDNIIGSFGLDDVTELAEDVDEGRYVFLITFFTCLLVTGIYALMIYSLTGVIVWVSIFGVALGILGLAAMLRAHARKIKPRHAPAKGQPSPVENDHNGKLITFMVYLLYGTAGLYMICVACMWKNIKISIAVLKTTSVIVFRNMRLLLLPLFSGVFVVAWTALWLYFFFLLLSTAKITQPTKGAQAKSLEFSAGQKQLLFFSIFMYFWVMEFILAVFQFTLMTGVCTWYFTSSQDSRGSFRLRQGFWWAFRYNQGSIALGSFVLAIVWSLRVVLEFITEQVARLKEKSAVAGCVVACTQCCVDCFHRFIKSLNKNAYCLMALTGDSFCSSAIQAYVLALKNLGDLFINDGIGKLLHSLGKVFISVSNTGIGYLVITYVPSYQEDIDQPVPFLVLILIMSYKLAAAFMDVYQDCGLVILQCLYADVDICK